MGKRELWRKAAGSGYLQAFLIGLFTAILSFLLLIIRGDGVFILCNDFNEQQIPFHMLANRSVREGNILWNWSIDLGSSFVGALGFYVLGSPFAWISFLFPPEWYPYVTGWLYMLKYAVAATFAYGYISRFTGKRYAIAGSLIYAFSGFQSVNLVFHHFHDAVAFFPLMLIGYEKMAGEGRKGVLAFGVFVNAFVNYYFFIQEVIFLILYFLFREGFHLWKKRRLILKCMGEGVLGTGMAGILLIPSVLFTLENPRLSRLIPMDQWIYRGNRDYLQVIRTLLFPGELMNGPSCIRDYDWTSWSSYLPMVSLILVICFLLKKWKSWLGGLLLFCIAATGIPLLNSMFGLFSDTNYHRWLYMPILLMALASAYVLEHRKEFPLLRAAAGVTVFMVCLTLGICWWSENRFQMINDPGVFWLWSVTGIMGAALTGILSGLIHQERRFILGMGMGIALFSVFTTTCTQGLYRKGADYTTQSYYDRLMAYQELELPDDRYRIHSSDNRLNMAASLSGTGSFTSMVNGSVYRFYQSLGREREIFTPDGVEGLRELVGGKYYVTKEPAEGDKILQKIARGRHTFYLCEYEYAVPIGCSFETYITSSEFEEIPAQQRGLAMLQCLVIPDEREDEVKEVLRKADREQIVGLTSEDTERLAVQRSSHGAVSLEKDRTGFTARFKTDRPAYAFFSVPYDKGFQAYVNGERTEIIDTNGMMAVFLGQGNNEVRFIYRNYDLMLGVGCTVICFILWGVWAGGKRSEKREYYSDKKV